MNRRAVGAAYEKLAGSYLTQQGYQVLEYNFCCRGGEIDIVAREGEYLVFVEVKYRRTGASGAPSEAVGSRKRRSVCHAAAYYCYVHGYGEAMPCRFDVVSICGEEVTLFRNAFDYCL